MAANYKYLAISSGEFLFIVISHNVKKVQMSGKGTNSIRAKFIFNLTILCPLQTTRVAAIENVL